MIDMTKTKEIAWELGQKLGEVVEDAYKQGFNDGSKAIPSTEPKTGHWKRISMDKYTEHAQHWYRCEKCGKENLGNTNFCPNCGAKMVEPQERSDKE